jgi:hypothetical protein
MHSILTFCAKCSQRSKIENGCERDKERTHAFPNRRAADRHRSRSQAVELGACAGRRRPSRGGGVARRGWEGGRRRASCRRDMPPPLEESPGAERIPLLSIFPVSIYPNQAGPSAALRLGPVDLAAHGLSYAFLRHRRRRRGAPVRYGGSDVPDSLETSRHPSGVWDRFVHWPLTNSIAISSGLFLIISLRVQGIYSGCKPTAMCSLLYAFQQRVKASSEQDTVSFICLTEGGVPA